MAKRYRKIHTRIWNDEKFLSLSDDGQLAFLFVLTHPQLTMLGAMRATIPGLAAEKFWPTERMRKALRKAFMKGLLRYDERACFLWAPHFLRYNKPESPNVVKSWETSLDLLPECELKSQLLQEVKGFLEGLPESFQEAFQKSMPNQEQEQEQDKKKNMSTYPSSLGAKKRRRKPDPIWDVIVELWFPSGVSRTQKTRVGKLVRDFKAKSNATPEEIRARFVEVASKWGPEKATPETVEKHWDQFGPGAEQSSEFQKVWKNAK